MAAFLSGKMLVGQRLIAPASRPARLQVTASSNGATATLPQVTDIYGTTAVLGPDMNSGGVHSMPLKDGEPISAEVQALIDEQGIDFELSGLKFLSNEGRVSLSSCVSLF